MATIKAYTTIEQSKKLLEILGPDSADMYYDLEESNIPNFIYGSHSDFRCFTMCWSLVALLNIIPKRIKDFNVLRIDINEKDFSIWYDEIGSGVNTELPDITTDNPVDACYEIIIKLHELNLL